MDNQLIQEFQNVKSTLDRIESEKIKIQTELDLKTKELLQLETQIRELGVDPLHIEEAVEEKKQAFSKALQEAKEMLDNVSRTQN